MLHFNNYYKITCIVLLAAVALPSTTGGVAYGESLTTTLQDSQNQIVSTLAGAIGDNTSLSTLASQSGDVKSLIKAEVKAAEMSFITYLINLLLTAVEQEISQIPGLAVPTPTPTP